MLYIKDNRYRFVVGFLTLLNTTLVALLCGQVRDTRDDIEGLRHELVTKQDLINVAAPKLTMFTQEKCTECHSERRFAGPHANVPGRIDQALAHMGSLPDADISEEDFAKIHGSLAVMRCAQCHGLDKLRTLAIKSPKERMQIIREMIAKPQSKISPDDAEEISESLEQMLGF